jgi:hypothetical protein
MFRAAQGPYARAPRRAGRGTIGADASRLDAGQRSPRWGLEAVFTSEPQPRRNPPAHLGGIGVGKITETSKKLFDDLANAVAGLAAVAKRGSYDSSLSWVSGSDDDFQRQRLSHHILQTAVYYRQRRWL